MSYVDKKFCFTCKLDTEQLEKKKKKLSNCSVCKIAQYCGQDCQRIDYMHGSHKFLCKDIYKRCLDLAGKAKKILDQNGHDATMSSLHEFYAQNDTVLKCLKKENMAYKYSIPSDAEKHPLECGKTIDIGQVFWTYVNCKSASAKALGEIARFNESYRGIEITLDAYLENILALQPDRMYLRALVPLLMLQLGKDDDAYNFIKFWLKNTPKNFPFKVGEDGLFPQLPFSEITMKNQDKNEDIFKVLEKTTEKPYFIYFPFYVCLAIIKWNIYLATKDYKQERQFIICLKYIKNSYKHLLKDGLQAQNASGNSWKPKITSDHELQKVSSCGVQEVNGQKISGLDDLQFLMGIHEVQIFASDFIANFMSDLGTYLTRAPKLKKEMLKHL